MEYKVVACGIDSLVVGYYIEAFIDLDAERLNESKVKAGEKTFGKTDSPIELGGTGFNVLPRGASGGYEWVLRNDDISVCIAKEARGGKVMPEVYITFSAHFLWSKGVVEATQQVKEWLSKWAVVIEVKPSRCDLCMDLAHPLPVIDLNREVVAMAKKRVDHGDGFKTDKHAFGRCNTGYTFGSHKLMGRIYDKTTEIVQHKKEWMREHWLANGWDGVSSVTRYEFQAGREFLKTMSVSTMTDLLHRLPDLWHFYTYDWLRICNEGSATNQARWQVKDYWKVMQSGYLLFGQALGVTPRRVKRVRYEHLIKQARGCLVTACAVLASIHGEEEALYRLRQELRDITVSFDFRNEVKRRIGSVANMETPDTHLVDAAIRMGAKPILNPPDKLGGDWIDG